MANTTMAMADITSTLGASALSAVIFATRSAWVMVAGSLRKSSIFGNACPMKLAGILPSAAMIVSAMAPCVTASIMRRSRLGTASIDTVAINR